MITTEKRREYRKRFEEKHPGRSRELWHKWQAKQTIKELTAKVEEQNAVIADLQEKLEKAEHDARVYSAKLQRLTSVHSKAKEYLAYRLQDAPDAVSIFHGLDLIFESED